MTDSESEKTVVDEEDNNVFVNAWPVSESLSVKRPGGY